MSILDKFKAPTSSESGNGATQPATQELTPAQALAARLAKATGAATPASTSAPTSANQSSALKSLLAASSSVAKVEATNQAALAVKSQLQVPEDLIALNPDLEAISGFPVEEIKQSLASLYVALETDQKDIATLCNRINTNMRQYEDLAYLLTPEQINLYIKGLMFLKKVNIATKAPKNTAAANIKAALKGDGLNFDFDIKL